MTLRLTVSRATWRAQIAQFANAVDGLVPVVKGHGYGIGQDVIMPIAAELGDTIAVGSIHETSRRPEGARLTVLTPVTSAPEHDDVVLTVGSLEHVSALDGWHGAVVVKLATSMRRYGASEDELTPVLAAIDDAGLTRVGFSAHPPVAITEEQRVAELERWVERLRRLDTSPHHEGPQMLAVSHLRPETFAVLRDRHRDLEWKLRAGTALWHGDKTSLHLTADVLGTRAVAAGERVGYRQVAAPDDGTIVMIGAGSANGVAPLVDGDGRLTSPFHLDRRRLPLLEIHMHTSMALVAGSEEPPHVGATVDVQRPLIGTFVDELVWR